MRGRADLHARFRDLLAARLDRQLLPAELRSLNAHLKGCAACKQVEREYRAGRQLLRGLPSRIPPRDLWVRTSGALDREVARGSFRTPRLGRGFGDGRRSSSASAAVITSVAAVGLVAALAVMQLGPSFRPAPDTTAYRPTPFAVAPQQLAFVGSGAADIAVYSTQVSQMCPASALDCLIDEGIERTALTLPGNLRPRNVALSPNGNQLALVGRDVGDDVFAVVTMPLRGSSGGAQASPPGAGTATDRPTTDPGNGPVGPTLTPDSSAVPGASSAPTGQASGEPVAPTNGGPPSVPPSSAVPGLTVLAILEHVHGAGAPPAWSADTDMLAFSAMPADGSRGPDIYVWAPGDQQARMITNDHASFFASWSGGRIVASRVVTGADGAASLTTVVIDPGTLEERRVDLPPVWLPLVNSPRSHAVAWFGTLAYGAGLPEPHLGALYLINWALIDPFADELAPPASPTPDSSASASSGAAPSAPASTPTPLDPLIKAQNVNRSPAASASPTADATAVPGETTAQPPIPALLVPIDPERDPAVQPVIDWQARWSTDGQVLGVWVADVPGSTWGLLEVRTLTAPDAARLHDDPLLAATLARRGFTLGLSRVAWVAPQDSNPDGELRIQTWGSDGVGGLFLRSLDLQEVVPAF